MNGENNISRILQKDKGLSMKSVQTSVLPLRKIMCLHTFGSMCPSTSSGAVWWACWTGCRHGWWAKDQLLVTEDR